MLERLRSGVLISVEHGTFVIAACFEAMPRREAQEADVRQDTLSALTDDAPTPAGPSAPHTGSPGGYRDEEGGHPS